MESFFGSQNSDDSKFSVARNDAESTEDGRLPPSAHIVHLKGDCKTRGEFIGSKMFNGCTVGIWENVDVGRR